MSNFKKEVQEIVSITCQSQGPCSICKGQTRHIIAKFRKIIDLIIPEGSTGELKTTREQLLFILQ